MRTIRLSKQRNLDRRSELPAILSEQSLTDFCRVHWTSAIASTLPSVTYKQVMESEEGVWEWVKRIVSQIVIAIWIH